jgi:hypothetical protein
MIRPGHNSDAATPQERGAVVSGHPSAGQKKAKPTKGRVCGKAAAARSCQQESPLLDIKEAAEYLHMGIFMLRQRAGREIPYVQYGGGTSPFLFLQSDLDKFIQEHRNDFSS